MAANDRTGRPQNTPAIINRFGTPEAMTEALQSYVDGQAAKEEYLTFAGVGIVLGVSDRTVLRYGVGDTELPAEWLGPIKETLSKIDAQDEQLLRSGKPVGAIFIKKNRGWTDQQQISVDLAGDGWGELLASLNRSGSTPGLGEAGDDG